LISIFISAFSTLRAQSQTNTSNSTGSIPVAATPQADFSESIDPMSVTSFTDDELNATFDKMSAHYSKNAVLFNNIAATYFKRKMYDKAESAIKRAIVITNHPAFLTNLSVIYDNQNRYPEAIAAVQRAIAQSPRYARARTQLCELLMVTKKNADAVLCYDELSKITSLDDYSLTLYAVASERSGNADKALELITPLIRGPQPTALMYNAYGHALYQKKRYAQAVDAFRQGVSIEPDSSIIRYNLAVALESVNDHDGALMQYSLMKTKDTSLADKLYKGLNRNKIIYVNEATASKKP
jgi:tetratricopeptide (TPR) repeat protein